MIAPAADRLGLTRMKAAGVYVFAGGLEENVDAAFSADPTSGTLTFTDGPFVETKEFLDRATPGPGLLAAGARSWSVPVGTGSLPAVVRRGCAPAVMGF